MDVFNNIDVFVMFIFMVIKLKLFLVFVLHDAKKSIDFNKCCKSIFKPLLLTFEIEMCVNNSKFRLNV